MRQRATFNRMGADGAYNSVGTDAAGNYVTPLLPKLLVHVPTLWRDEIPTMIDVIESVRAMLDSA